MFWLTKSITWHYVGWNLLSCFLLVLQSFLGVSRGSRRVLNRTLHVSVDSDGKLFKTFVTSKRISKTFVTSKSYLWRQEDLLPVNHLSLVLDQDSDVHEHLVQLLDRRLQLHKHLVPWKVQKTMINFCQKKQASILILSLGITGFENWSLNKDFSVWLEENQFYPEQNKISLPQVKCVLF